MKTPITEQTIAEPIDSETVLRPSEGARRVPLTEHLEELRRRLWVCVGVVTVASVASLAWTETLIMWLKRPAGNALPQLAFFSPPEAMVAYLKVAVTAGLVLSLPVVLYEVWAFIRTGLTRQERGMGVLFVWWGSVLFVAGGAFAYGVLLPIALPFLLSFGGGQVEPVISISRYLSFTTTVIVACGAVFQLPLAVFLLATLGFVNAATLRRKWRHAVVIMTLTAAILTPTTDVATMLLMVVPMLALYEVSTWVAAIASRKRGLNG